MLFTDRHDLPVGFKMTKYVFNLIPKTFIPNIFVFYMHVYSVNKCFYFNFQVRHVYRDGGIHHRRGGRTSLLSDSIIIYIRQFIPLHTPAYCVNMSALRRYNVFPYRIQGRFYPQ